MPNHPVSSTCEGEKCGMCWRSGETWPAQHKVGEEIPFDDPMPKRHNYTQYVCCQHFCMIMGTISICFPDIVSLKKE